MKRNHLRQEERYTIERLLESGYAQKEVAEALGRSESTISRERSRNGCAEGGAYCSRSADKLAADRRREASSRAKRMTPAVIKHVERQMREQQWSPDQIGATMPAQLGGRLSHESIYRHVRRDRAAGGDLFRHLRHRGKRKRSSVANERRGKLRNATPIEKRPAIVERRGRHGDWEFDLMECADGYVVVCRERRTQFLRLGRLETKGAVAVAWMVAGLMAGLKRHTITWDRGQENSRHELVDEILGSHSYFCDAYCSWQKGCVENSNGLLRQYLPRCGSVMGLSDAEFAAIEAKLNSRPRKLLGYRTPMSFLKTKLLNGSPASRNFIN